MRTNIVHYAQFSNFSLYSFLISPRMFSIIQLNKKKIITSLVFFLATDYSFFVFEMNAYDADGSLR